MNALTISCFFGLFVFSLLGLYSARYEDNWLQHFGLIGVGISSVVGIHKMYHMEWVPPEMTLFALSAFLFACGTTLKVWKYRHHPRHHKKHVEHKHGTDKQVPSKTP